MTPVRSGARFARVESNLSQSGPRTGGTQMEHGWNADGTQLERTWNADGTQNLEMERKWNADTQIPSIQDFFDV